MKKLILIAVGIMLTSGINAQTTKEDGLKALKRCAELYLQLKEFSVDVEYGVFYNSTNFGTPNETENGRIVRKGQQFYQEEAGNITLINKDYQVRVNNQARVISVANRAKEDKIPTQITLDSLENYVHSVQALEGGYSFTFEKGPVEKMDFFFTENGYLKKMRNHYRHPIDFGEGKMKIVTQIRYHNFKKGVEDASIFGEKNYVKVTKEKEVIPLEKYRNYHVLNQLR